MPNPVIALPVSQYFDIVFPQITDVIGVLLVNDLRRLPPDFNNYSYPKAYHTNGLIDNHFSKKITDGLIDSLNSYGIYHISVDCGPSCSDVYFHPEKNDIYWPVNTSNLLKPEDILKIGQKRIEGIKIDFQGSIALENLDYHPGGAYEYVCDPVFITEMVERLDVYFAIDIAHVLVTTFNFNIKPLQYIKRLPLKRVGEVHLSHPEDENDKHDCPTSYEYNLLEYVLANSNPEFVVLEYYQNAQKIIDENIKLYRLLNR